MPSSRRALLASALAAGVAGCTDRWANGDADHTSIEEPVSGTEMVGGSTPTEPPEYAVWIRETPADHFGVVSLGGGPETPRLFVGSVDAGEDDSGDDTLRALDLQSGEEHWHVGVDHPVQTPPMYLDADDGTRFLFATGRTSRFDVGFVVQAVDPDERDRAWRFGPEEHRLHYPLAIEDDTVSVGRRDDHGSGEFVYALDGNEGSELWRTETGDVVSSGHTARRDLLFVDTLTRLRALALQDGQAVWSVPAESHAYDNRAERVFVQADGEDVVRGLAHAGGAELWRRAFEFNVTRITSPRAAMDETVHVGD